MSSYYSRLAQRTGFGAVVKPQISDENACIRKERHSSNEIAEAIVCDSTLLFLLTKKNTLVFSFLAQRTGFEPAEPFSSHAFQACALNHSTISAYY